MQAVKACAGDLASGVPGHLTQRTKRGRPGGCITGLLRGRPCRPRRPHHLHHRRVFFNTRSAGACLLANTPSRELAAALPCAPVSAGKEGRCDTNSAGAAGASPGVPQGLPEG